MGKHHVWMKDEPKTNLDWLIIIFAGIAFYHFAGSMDWFLGVLNDIVRMLTPFAGGVVLAYILDPIVRLISKQLLNDNKKLRWIGIIVAYLVAAAILFLLGMLIIPQLISSVSILFNNIPMYVDTIQATLVSLETKYGLELSRAMEAVENYETIMDQIYTTITSWTPQIVSYIGNVASNMVTVFTAIASSMYMLIDKDHLLHQIQTVANAVLPPRTVKTAFRICRDTNKNFSNFFFGKIIDSGIIGLLTFVLMTILRLDFPVLISVIVGITNIIPVFGPFIGAVPSIIVLLFVDPLQAFEFLILILIIQQLDGNFIGPKILGESIGISALWILFSIVLGGDMFGIVGMVLGVPTFATLYGLAEELVHWSLKNRGINAEGEPLPKENAAQPLPAETEAAEPKSEKA